MFISKKYVSLDKERVSIYSFVSSCVEKNSLNSFFNSCISKYGPPPKPFKNLFKSKEISLLLYDRSISKVVCSKGSVFFYFSNFNEISFDSLVVLLDDFFKQKDINYFFENNQDEFIFRFTYKDKDVYILVEKLVRFLYL